MNPVKNFFVLLTLSILVVFGLHLFFLHSNKYPLFENKILLSYFLNFFLAIAIYVLIYSLRTKLKNYLGFLFIGGSFLKFILFFILFYPFYLADETISILEFSSFFVPYLICLITETYALANLLNRLK